MAYERKRYVAEMKLIMTDDNNDDDNIDDDNIDDDNSDKKRTTTTTLDDNIDDDNIDDNSDKKRTTTTTTLDDNIDDKRMIDDKKRTILDDDDDDSDDSDDDDGDIDEETKSSSITLTDLLEVLQDAKMLGLDKLKVVPTSTLSSRYVRIDLTVVKSIFDSIYADQLKNVEQKPHKLQVWHYLFNLKSMTKTKNLDFLYSFSTDGYGISLNFAKSLERVAKKSTTTKQPMVKPLSELEVGKTYSNRNKTLEKPSDLEGINIVCIDPGVMNWISACPFSVSKGEKQDNASADQSPLKMADKYFAKSQKVIEDASQRHTAATELRRLFRTWYNKFSKQKKHKSNDLDKGFKQQVNNHFRKVVLQLGKMMIARISNREFGEHMANLHNYVNENNDCVDERMVKEIDQIYSDWKKLDFGTGILAELADSIAVVKSVVGRSGESNSTKKKLKAQADRIFKQVHRQKLEKEEEHTKTRLHVDFSKAKVYDIAERNAYTKKTQGKLTNLYQKAQSLDAFRSESSKTKSRTLNAVEYRKYLKCCLLHWNALWSHHSSKSVLKHRFTLKTQKQRYLDRFANKLCGGEQGQKTMLLIGNAARGHRFGRVKGHSKGPVCELMNLIRYTKRAVVVWCNERYTTKNSPWGGEFDRPGENRIEKLIYKQGGNASRPPCRVTNCKNVAECVGKCCRDHVVREQHDVSSHTTVKEHLVCHRDKVAALNIGLKTVATALGRDVRLWETESYSWNELFGFDLIKTNLPKSKTTMSDSQPVASTSTST
eukprot:CAMPEP_0201561852 /NCGR_PEP_ID=MMETSP0173_2-20130828/79013_1 /ASSEMBLY_ACC=CAM_ASM_000268 /TAXON_ID=218659 /ORGANISM="Vexillifera sp., Strain DIVA3 564/2" /LENGTH=768 /DNA_ID=CAMNT_0047976373 /DNA_START=648 /DNA_END=2954 /DNA_ORIENTATION=-